MADVVVRLHVRCLPGTHFLVRMLRSVVGVHTKENGLIIFGAIDTAEFSQKKKAMSAAAQKLKRKFEISMVHTHTLPLCKFLFELERLKRTLLA